MLHEWFTIENTSPLPQRAAPQPWEDITSVISRTARKMGYDDPKWILQPEHFPHRIDPESLPLLCQNEDYRMLELLLALRKETLLSLTLHRFAPRFASQAILDPPNEPRTELPQDRFFFRDNITPFSPIWQNIRVCPLCLDEPNGYDRLYWRVGELLSCPRHRVFLIDQCPDCQAPIPALRLDLTLCPWCKRGDYRSRIIPLPEEEAWLLTSQNILIDHLGIDAAELGEHLPAHESSLLHTLSPSDYFSLANNLQGLFNSHPMGSHLRPFLMRTLSFKTHLAQTVRSSLILVHYLLADWPTHFWGMLEQCQHALWEDSFRFERSHSFVERWNIQFAQSDYWGEEAYCDEPTKLLCSFSDTMSTYFRFYRDRVWHNTHVFGETILPEGHPYIRRLVHPTKEEAVVPFPWEDLTSVICRTARAMNYGHPSWALVSAEPPRRKIYTSDIPCLHRRDDYQVLERQLGIDEEGLYTLSLHRFVGVIQPLEKTGATPAGVGDITRPLLERDLVNTICFPLNQTKVCPACLDEAEGYDRIYWRFHSVVICPQHRLLLIDCCPTCRASIPTLRLHLTTCPSCGQGDYRQAPRLQVPRSSWLGRGQDLLFQFINAEGRQSYQQSAYFVESPLLQIQPWQYFEFLTTFHHLFLLLPSKSVLLHAFSELVYSTEVLTMDSPALQAMAIHLTFFHFVFALWPEHFLALINVFTSIMKTKQIGKGLFETLWDPNNVFRCLWLPPQHADNAYGSLVHILQKWIYWGLGFEAPGEQPLSPTYRRGCTQLLEEHKERFGLEPQLFLRAW